MKRKLKRSSFSLSVSRHREALTIGTIPVILTLVGLFFIFEASSVSSYRILGDSYHYLKLQFGWFMFGIVVMSILSFIDYNKLYYFAFPTIVACIVFLILVLVPGIGEQVSGARRWIHVGPIGFQPTEFAKFATILYLSSWFLYKERQRFLPFLLLLSFMIGLIMIQPDLGTSVILFLLFILIYFISGEAVKYLLLLIPLAGAGFILMVTTSAYRLERVLSFLNPNIDPQGISYHLRQILISLSSGGIIGRGFTASRQKYQFLPEAHTDSIFAILGEETGFVGGFLLICMYGLLLFYLYKVAGGAKNKFGKLLAGSIMCLVGIQVLINLGGMVNLIPLTGVPLPFFSYGGSSLLIFYAMLGIVINIKKQST